MKKMIIYVPCYNEEEGVIPLATSFNGLREKIKRDDVQLEVIWVNDASSDSTANKLNQICKDYDFCRAIHHESNRGLVGVLETSLQDAQNYSEELVHSVGLLDGDNSHPPEFFRKMIEQIDLGYDVVIASRFQVGSLVQGVPLNRQILSLGMSLLFRSMGRIPNVRDYSCGFRLYSPKIFLQLKSYKFKKRSFACMVELLKACHMKGALCCEISFILRYDKKLSSSKMRIYRTIKETLGVLLG